jgi:AcrR family transcriptional regulator
MILADEGGIEALTMRKIAGMVGAEAMSLYRHVQNKEDILDGIVDLVFAEIELPSNAARWRTEMERWATSAHDALLRHPWALGLTESRSRPGRANLRHHDVLLAFLESAGFAGLMAMHAYNVLDSYVYGFVLQEASLLFETPEELSRVTEQVLPESLAEEYPHLHWLGAELTTSGFVYRDEFGFGLDLILEGLERIRASAKALD